MFPNTQEDPVASALAALAGPLRNFMPAGQIAILKDCLTGEEALGISRDVLSALKAVLATPVTYATDGQGEEAVVYLHYFGRGADAWITERDVGDTPDGDGLGEQYQAFGKISLTGRRQDAELGYISIKELIESGLELDMFWIPKNLKSI